MIPKIGRGSRTYGLLAYLYGPGRREEHADPHLVASWDGFAPDPHGDPAGDPQAKAVLARLADALDLRVKQAGTAAPAQHVWHCSVRTAPGDRPLTDGEWNTVAHRLVQAVGLAPDDDPDCCRWVAVRHAEDHIHIVATLVRGDLRRPRMNYDYKRAQAACRRIEREWGLRRLNAGDGTAAKTPTSAECFKAERLGLDQTPRDALREAVRQSLAGAATETEFFTRLREHGVRVKPRLGPSGDALGYSVALPGDRNADGRPIWYPGSQLAPDLSLPKIRARLTTSTQEAAPSPGPGGRARTRPSTAHSRRDAASAADHATTALTRDGGKAAAHLPAAGELLDALVQTAPPATRSQLREAARAFERATRSHVRAEHAEALALRTAARGILRAGPALGRGEDGAATAMLLSALVLLAAAAAHWHAQRGHAQQAHAARQAAAELRAAYRTAATTPMRALRDQGRALPPAQREHLDAAIDAALPAVGGQDGSRAAGPGSEGAGRDALAATLAQAEHAGHDPETLLREAIAVRELDTADNIDDVLVWRIRRLARLPAPTRRAAERRGATGTATAPTAGHPAALPAPRPRPDAPQAPRR
jgi:hypothetical protein